MRKIEMGISKKNFPVTLIIRNGTDKSKIRYPDWREAHDHIRQVILGQIVEELAELALQDDPSEWTEEIERLKDLAKSVNYPKDEKELRYAAEEWMDFTDHDPHFTVIEIL